MYSSISNRICDHYVREFFSYREYVKAEADEGQFVAESVGWKVAHLIRELFGSNDGKALIEPIMAEYSAELGLDFKYETAVEECRWLLDPSVVFADHHDWRAEPLRYVTDMKSKALEVSQQGVRDEENPFNKTPVVFIFMPHSIFIEVDRWPEDFDTGLSDYRRSELTRISGLEEQDFLGYGWYTFNDFWCHKKLRPEDYLKAVRLANLVTRMHGNPDFQAWFNSDREVIQDSEAMAIAPTHPK